jgi:hypothetical protein
MFRLCPSGDPNGPLRPVRYEIARALMSMTRSKSKAGYIDARPHIRQLEEVLLQRMAGAGPYMWVNRAISRARRHVCSRRAYVFRNAPAAHSVGPLLLIRIMCSLPVGSDVQGKWGARPGLVWTCMRTFRTAPSLANDGGGRRRKLVGGGCSPRKQALPLGF